MCCGAVAVDLGRLLLAVVGFRVNGLLDTDFCQNVWWLIWLATRYFLEYCRSNVFFSFWGRVISALLLVCSTVCVWSHNNLFSNISDKVISHLNSPRKFIHRLLYITVIPCRNGYSWCKKVSADYWCPLIRKSFYENLTRNWFCQCIEKCLLIRVSVIDCPLIREFTV